MYLTRRLDQIEQAAVMRNPPLDPAERRGKILTAFRWYKALTVEGRAQGRDPNPSPETMRRNRSLLRSLQAFITRQAHKKAAVN